mmetsp:Transcript_4141/g.18751  ORF Transcript_4141/g.18751 Transcript_4141/m.18751 type:complete len:258 (+) Transcript_4141:373-1146(+)
MSAAVAGGRSAFDRSDRTDEPPGEPAGGPAVSPAVLSRLDILRPRSGGFGAITSPLAKPASPRCRIIFWSIIARLAAASSCSLRKPLTRSTSSPTAGTGSRRSSRPSPSLRFNDARLRRSLVLASLLLWASGCPYESSGGGRSAAPYRNAADLAAAIAASCRAFAAPVAPSFVTAKDVSRFAIRVASSVALITAEFVAVKPPACAESIELVSNGLWLRALTFASFFAASRKAPERPAVCSTVTSRRRGGGEGAKGSP